MTGERCDLYMAGAYLSSHGGGLLSGSSSYRRLPFHSGVTCCLGADFLPDLRPFDPLLSFPLPLDPLNPRSLWGAPLPKSLPEMPFSKAAEFTSDWRPRFDTTDANGFSPNL